MAGNYEVSKSITEQLSDIFKAPLNNTPQGQQGITPPALDPRAQAQAPFGGGRLTDGTDGPFGICEIDAHGEPQIVVPNAIATYSETDQFREVLRATMAGVVYMVKSGKAPDILTMDIERWRPMGATRPGILLSTLALEVTTHWLTLRWGHERVFAHALAMSQKRLTRAVAEKIATLPDFPDVDGWWYTQEQMERAHRESIELLAAERAADGRTSKTTVEEITRDFEKVQAQLGMTDGVPPGDAQALAGEECQCPDCVERRQVEKREARRAKGRRFGRISGGR